VTDGEDTLGERVATGGVERDGREGPRELRGELGVALPERAARLLGDGVIDALERALGFRERRGSRAPRARVR
jgi:hypothetical protein